MRPSQIYLYIIAARIYRLFGTIGLSGTLPLVLLFLFSSPTAIAQPTFPVIQFVPVHITSTPELISTLYGATHAKNIGKHNIIQCNDGVTAVDVPKERTLQALKDLPVIDVTEAVILVTQQYNNNPKFTLTRYAEYGLIAVGALSGGAGSAVVQLSSKTLARLVAGIGLAHLLGDRLRGEVPSLAPFLANALTDTVHLGPAGSANQCVSRVVFTGVIHGVHGYDVVVQMPVAPPTPTTNRVADNQPQPPAALTSDDQKQLVAAVAAVPLWQHQ